MMTLVDLSVVHLHFDFNFRIHTVVIRFVYFICRFMFLLVEKKKSGEIYYYMCDVFFFRFSVAATRQQHPFCFNLSNVHSIRAIRISYFIVNLVFFLVYCYIVRDLYVEIIIDRWLTVQQPR